MLAMAQIKYIKHLREKEGKSIQAISNILDIDWRTSKKYADCEDFNLAVPQKRSGCLVVGGQESPAKTATYGKAYL